VLERARLRAEADHRRRRALSPDRTAPSARADATEFPSTSNVREEQCLWALFRESKPIKNGDLEAALVKRTTLFGIDINRARYALVTARRT
jgi:hypothetical protein